ncbi:MAG TPA: DUF5719 family protein [Microbacteriaceae bacterium]|nr:DUF5719 family protein [Microbacteriaceae bacterium]
MTDPQLDDQLAPDEEARVRVSARSVAIWGARASGGIVGVGIAVAVAGAAIFVNPPVLSVDPAVVVVHPEPAAQLLVCPGPLLRLADDSGQNASEASPIGDRPYVTFGSVSGTISTSAIAQSDAGTGGTRLAPQVALVTPVDGAEPIVAGIQSSRVRAEAGNVVGYATASCGQPTLRSWIIGGSTQLGRTSILTIINPSNVEATVDLTLSGESGAIAAAGLRGIVVPPGSQRVIPVSGFSLEQRAPVIGITSTGGNVAAFLQQSIIRTLIPGGVDLIGQQTPSTTLVMAGIEVAGEEALSSINATPVDEDDTMPTLRLFAPGASTLDATVAIIPVGSTLADALDHPRVEEVGDALTDAHDHTPEAPEPTSFEVTLTAGAVSEIPITGIAAGEYTIVVTAEEPLVGAVRASATGTQGIDFAWYAPIAELSEQAVVVTPDADAVVLTIANTTDADRIVTMTGPDGEETVEIPAGSAVSTAVDPRAEYALAGMAGLRAAVRSGVEGLTAQSPVLPAAPLARPVQVHV